jgi:hypothetical protein
LRRAEELIAPRPELALALAVSLTALEAPQI